MMSGDPSPAIDNGIRFEYMDFCILADGIPLRAITYAAQNSTLVISDTIQEEIYRVVSAKFGWSEDRTTDALSAYIEYSIWGVS